MKKGALGVHYTFLTRLKPDVFQKLKWYVDKKKDDVRSYSRNEFIYEAILEKLEREEKKKS